MMLSSVKSAPALANHQMTCWTILYFHKQNNKQPRWRFKSYLGFEEDAGPEARTTQSISLDGIPELMNYGDTSEKKTFVALFKEDDAAGCRQVDHAARGSAHPFLTNSFCQVPKQTGITGAVNAEALRNSHQTGKKNRRSRFSSRITKWIRKIRLCFPSVHQQSSQDRENAPHEPNSAADSGHKLRRKDQKLLTAA